MSDDRICIFREEYYYSKRYFFLTSGVVVEMEENQGEGWDYPDYKLGLYPPVEENRSRRQRLDMDCLLLNLYGGDETVFLAHSWLRRSCFGFFRHLVFVPP
jgi:hypothetical protein